MIKQLVEQAGKPISQHHHRKRDISSHRNHRSPGRHDTTRARTLLVFTAVILLALAVVALHIVGVLHQPLAVVLALAFGEVLARVVLCSQNTNVAAVIYLRGVRNQT